MKKGMSTDERMKRFSVIGFIFTVITGTLFHFAFEASGGNTLVGAFTPVNESVWEHLKLTFFPALLFGISEYFVYGREKSNFFPSKVIGIFVGTFSTAVLYYTYSGMIGRDFVPIDILLFVIGSGTAFFIPYILMKKEKLFKSDNAVIISILVLAVAIFIFIYFTFHTPMLELFRDPLSEDFGIAAV